MEDMIEDMIEDMAGLLEMEAGLKSHKHHYVRPGNARQGATTLKKLCHYLLKCDDEDNYLEELTARFETFQAKSWMRDCFNKYCDPFNPKSKVFAYGKDLPKDIFKHWEGMKWMNMKLQSGEYLIKHRLGIYSNFVLYSAMCEIYARVRKEYSYLDVFRDHSLELGDYDYTHDFIQFEPVLNLMRMSLDGDISIESLFDNDDYIVSKDNGCGRDDEYIIETKNGEKVKINIQELQEEIREMKVFIEKRHNVEGRFYLYEDMQDYIHEYYSLDE